MTDFTALMNVARENGAANNNVRQTNVKQDSGFSGIFQSVRSGIDSKQSVKDDTSVKTADAPKGLFNKVNNVNVPADTSAQTPDTSDRVSDTTYAAESTPAENVSGNASDGLKETAEVAADILQITPDALAQLLALLGLQPPAEVKDIPEFLDALVKAVEGFAQTAETPKVMTLADFQNIVRLNVAVKGETIAETAQIVEEAPDLAAERLPEFAPVLKDAGKALKSADAETKTDAFELPLVEDKDGSPVTVGEIKARVAEYKAAVAVKAPAALEIPEETQAAGPEIEIPEESVSLKPDAEIKPQEEPETEESVSPEVKTEPKETKKETAHVAPHTANTGLRDPAQILSRFNQVQQDLPKVNTADIINQIVESARMTKADGTSSLEIQLRPAHLGKVSIVLTSTSEGVSAQIKTSSDSTRALLSGNMAELVASLKDSGVNMKNVEISKSENSWDFARNAFANDGGNNRENNRGENGGSGRGTRGDAVSVASTRISRLSNLLYGTAALQPAGYVSGDNSVEYLA